MIMQVNFLLLGYEGIFLDTVELKDLPDIFISTCKHFITLNVRNDSTSEFYQTHRLIET